MAEVTSLASGITDSEGNVVLQYTESSKGTKNYYVELDSGETSDTVSVEIIGIDFLSMETSNPITGVGQTSRITAKAISNNIPVPNVAINIGNETFKTNSDGEAYFDYEGTGVGIVEITGSCGGETETVTIEDVLMYYSQKGNKFVNFEYDTTDNATVLLRYNGIYAISQLRSWGKLRFPHIQSNYSDFLFEFDVVDFKTFANGGGSSGESIHVGVLTINKANLVNKQRIRVTISNQTMKAFANDVEIASARYTGNFTPFIELTSNCSITVDNIKIRKGVDL